MTSQRLTRSVLIAAILLLAGCANIPRREPVQVFVVGLEPLPGQGLEMRMLVKLRVQNPNDSPIEFNGVHVFLEVEGRRFASGVSAANGEAPRFGETLISVPVSMSAAGLVRGAMSAFDGAARGKIKYELKGRLAGPAFRSVRFNARGEIALPEGVYAWGEGAQ